MKGIDAITVEEGGFVVLAGTVISSAVMAATAGCAVRAAVAAALHAMEVGRPAAHCIAETRNQRQLELEGIFAGVEVRFDGIELFFQPDRARLRDHLLDGFIRLDPGQQDLGALELEVCKGVP
jgi:hypothetical protein